MKTLRILLVILTGLMAFSSCAKEPLLNPDPLTMNDLIVKGTFSWSTTNDYKFTLQGPVKGVIRITSSGGLVYKKGILTANQPLTMNLSIPAFEKSVTVRYNGQIVDVQLINPVITCTFK
jgi:hypothetical protein